MSRTAPRAIVVMLDRWGSSYLGPYGNTWLETPACNRLANEGITFEQALVNGQSLDDLYRRLWGGASGSWLNTLDASGISTTLIADDPQVLAHPCAAGFQQAEALETPRVRRPARTAERTVLGRLFTSALAAYAEMNGPQLVWIHGQAMSGPWDAPPEYRLQFADEEDPDPPLTVEPPVGPVPSDVDPDLLQGWRWAYAGQVSLLDECLQLLLDEWLSQPVADRPLLIVMGARGYALGEHGAWGAAASTLHSELVQVPLFVAAPDDTLARLRAQSLVQPDHVRVTLERWFGVADPPGADLWSVLRRESQPPERAAAPTLIVCRDGDEWAWRSPVWHCCYSAPTHRWQLYLKPDDHADVNDVASRCPQVVESFQLLLSQLAASADPVSAIATLPALPEHLFHGAD